MDPDPDSINQKIRTRRALPVRLQTDLIKKNQYEVMKYFCYQYQLTMRNLCSIRQDTFLFVKENTISILKKKILSM